MMIPGGYYIKARSIMRSEIMHSPPHVREVWDWLLMQANHMEHKVSGRTIKRGQLFTSIDNIRDGLCWYIGYRKERYTKEVVKASTKALKKASMITTTKTTRGMIITICNYDFYQNPINYESIHEDIHETTHEGVSRKHQTHATINKNDKKEEIIILPDWIPRQDWNDYLAMRKKIKKPATDRALKMAVTELEKLKVQGYDPAAVLQQSIFKNYPGLYPCNDSNKQQTIGSIGIC